MQAICRPLIALIITLLFCVSNAYAKDNVLNVYVWAGEVPQNVIEQFEKETGIEVNFTVYNDNETLYAKLKASKNSGYDIIEPSSNYLARMRNEGMLTKIDKSKLSNYKNLDPHFLHRIYDPSSDYSIPYLWGATGIFYNKQYYKPGSIKSWKDLWDKKYYNQIGLLNDPRAIFSMGMFTLGYPINNNNPKHIKQAYEKVKALLPNIKLFNTDAAPSIYIDDDTTVGMAWNGEIYQSQSENPNLVFVYPKEGFIIWVDNFAIPKNAPHLENAYKFLNFMLRPEIANQATLTYGFGTANLAARKQLPAKIRNNKTIFPSNETLKRGQFLNDVSDSTLNLYAKYWELLKLGA